MNIEDSTHKDEIEVKDPMKLVFEKQKSLMEKYKEIERLPDLPLNIDLAVSQVIIKDFKQRGMEEIAEAIEGFRNNEMLHFKEELIDALHFFVELSLLTGKDYDYYDYKYNQKVDNVSLNNLYQKTGMLTEKFGLLMNTLKNKPWKQSQVLTDVNKFNKLLKESFEYYIKYLHECGGMNYIDIYNIYCKKNEVNNFRISTNY
jgi:hypothetical protein